MNFQDLLKFIEGLDKILIKHFGKNSDQEKRILARTVKLNEEVGELCEAILAYNSDQRKEKLENYNKENLGEEFADVIITTLLLAKAIDVDIEKNLEDKIKKIKQRF